MLIPVLLFIVGLLCLIKGGDWFVGISGATGIARRLPCAGSCSSVPRWCPSVPPCRRSWCPPPLPSPSQRSPGGNAIGSVIRNAALIITIAVRPGKVDPKSLRTPAFFVAAAFYAGGLYTTGSFTRSGGPLRSCWPCSWLTSCATPAMQKIPPFPKREEQVEEGLCQGVGAAGHRRRLIAVGADHRDNGTSSHRRWACRAGHCADLCGTGHLAAGAGHRHHLAGQGSRRAVAGQRHRCKRVQLVLVSGVSVTLAPASGRTPPSQAGTLLLVMDIPVMFAVMLLRSPCPPDQGQSFSELPAGHCTVVHLCRLSAPCSSAFDLVVNVKTFEGRCMVAFVQQPFWWDDLKCAHDIFPERWKFLLKGEPRALPKVSHDA